LVFLAAKYYDIIASTKDSKEKEKYKLLLEMIIPMVKTYPSEAGAKSVDNGLQILGGYGFCSDFILQQYYRDIRIFALYEGTTGIQSQDLLGRKVTMEHGKGLELLSSEIMKTIADASINKDLKKHANMLTEKLQLTGKIVQHLLPFAAKGNYERYLADANLFMEHLSIVVVGWLWLEIALDASKQLTNDQRMYSELFYESKIKTMEYFFKYEIPKTNAMAEILMNTAEITIKTDKEYII